MPLNVLVVMDSCCVKAPLYVFPFNPHNLETPALSIRIIFSPFFLSFKHFICLKETNLFVSCAYVCEYICTCHDVRVEVRGQLSSIGSFHVGPGDGTQISGLRIVASGVFNLLTQDGQYFKIINKIPTQCSQLYW